jgi:FkbM family methyltransferase
MLPICQVELDDRLMIMLENDALTNMVAKNKEYEPHFRTIVNAFLNIGDRVIDAGANCGFHTITMSKLVGDIGKVYSFEPLRIIYQQLNCNVFINGLSNVTTYNCAIGNENKIISITPPNYQLPGNIGNTWVNLNSTGDSINMVKLDGFITEKIKFIKLDIQGCELFALNGMLYIIKTHNPILFVEMEDCHLTRYNTTTTELTKFIKNQLNYDVYQIINEYPCDHLCVPKNINISDKKLSINLRQV